MNPSLSPTLDDQLGLETEVKARRSSSLWRDTLSNVLHQRSAVVGLLILAMFIFVGVFADQIAPFDPTESLLGTEPGVTARAKGLGERSVVLRHAARNALLPVVTIIGLQLGALLSGAVLTETVFNLAGVGRSLYEAITGRDYVVIQGFTLLIAVIYVVVNLAVDISYGFLDPRVRLR